MKKPTIQDYLAKKLGFFVIFHKNTKKGKD
jgi:hypothetical protein